MHTIDELKRVVGNNGDSQNRNAKLAGGASDSSFTGTWQTLVRKRGAHQHRVDKSPQ